MRPIGRFRHVASPRGAFFIRVAPRALLLRGSKPVPAEPGAASCERPKHAANWSNIRWNAAITDQRAISELNITMAVIGMSIGSWSRRIPIRRQRRVPEAHSVPPVPPRALTENAKPLPPPGRFA
jgi:hypothetical protein